MANFIYNYLHMIYPIKNWPKLKRGYLFKQKTWYTQFHLGLDIICPAGTPIRAWQDLAVVNFMVGSEGGNTIQIKCPNNPRLFRLMHLLKPVNCGQYKEGQIIGYIGSTGKMSTGPHLHIDISKNSKLNIQDINNFGDPEIYFASLNYTNKLI